MTLQDLANIGEFVGGVVVVGTLAYLAIQVRQNTHSLRTENYGRALDRISAMQSLMSRNESFSMMFSRGVVDPSTLTATQRVQFTWAAYEAFGAFEFMFLQAQSKAMPQEVWDRWAGTVRWWLTFPGIRTWWATKPAPFSASFSAFVDDYIESKPELSASTERWQAFVRGSGADE